MINSKERSRLLALANHIETTMFVGKFGLTESVLAQIDEMLTDHELIKIGVQKNADFSAKEIIRPICEELNAEPVHAIGNKVIIYRYSVKEGIEHVNYKENVAKNVEEPKKKENKPKILGRKTFEYKSSKTQSRDGVKNKNTNSKGVKNTRSNSDYAPYKKDGVTIYKKKIGKPSSLKKSNKK